MVGGGGGGGGAVRAVRAVGGGGGGWRGWSCWGSNILFSSLLSGEYGSMWAVGAVGVLEEHVGSGEGGWGR